MFSTIFRLGMRTLPLLVLLLPLLWTPAANAAPPDPSKTPTATEAAPPAPAPKAPAEVVEDPITEGYKRAQKMIAEKRPAEEIQAIARYLIAEDPDDLRGWLLLGQSFMSDKANHKRAKKVLEYAQKEVDSDSPMPLIYLSSLAGIKKDSELSASLYSEAARLDIDDFGLQYKAGLLLGRLRRFAEAEEHFRFALEAKPHDPKGSVALGNLFVAQGHYSKAIELYQAALKKYPEDNMLFNNLCNAFIDSHRFDESLAAIEKKLLTAAPREHGVLQLLKGRTLMGMRKLEGAEKALRMVLSGATSKAEQIRAHYLLGLTLSRMGCALSESYQCTTAKAPTCCEHSREALEHFEIVSLDAYGSGSNADLPYRISLAQSGIGELDQAQRTVGEHYFKVRLGLAQFDVGELIEAEGTLHRLIKESPREVPAEAFGALAVTLLAFAERDGDDRDRKEAIRLFEVASERAVDFLHRDRLIDRRQWPPHAIDAIEQLQKLSEEAIAAAKKKSETNSTGCSCQTQRTSGQPETPIILGVMLFAALWWWRRRSDA